MREGLFGSKWNQCTQNRSGHPLKTQSCISTSALPASLREMQNFRPHLRLLTQNLHFNTFH